MRLGKSGPKNMFATAEVSLKPSSLEARFTVHVCAIDSTF